MRLDTLRGRLAAWYGLVLALTLCAFATVTYVVVANSEEEEAETGHEDPRTEALRVLEAIGFAFPVALAVSFAGAWWLTRRSLAPLEAIERTARDLGVEHLDRRIQLDAAAPQELRALAQSLNTMLSRLENAVAGIKRFTADASHQLRTPLTILRGELEVTLRKPRTEEELKAALENTLAELERMSALVLRLLTLARSDSGQRAPLVEVDLEPLVRKAVAPFEAAAAGRGLTLDVRGGGARARVDPVWLGEAVVNLVDNAYKFTPSGGSVIVEVASRDSKALIRVEDSGPGFEGDDPERLFERFQRGKNTQHQEGFGLGLPLARAVVRAMGGEVRARSRAAGGAETEIELPLA